MDKLRQVVFNKQIVLAEIYKNFGSLSLSDYAQSWKVAPSNQESEVFLKEMEKLLMAIYPADVVVGVISQLAKELLVSTIDHHGILNHPFFINSNLIYSLRQDSEYLVCLTTAGVSLNNSSWPGCLVMSEGENLKRFSFFPDKFKNKPVLTLPAIEPKNIDYVFGQLKNESLKEIFTKRVLELNNFSAQACLLSSALWSKIFPSGPKVIYLPVEDLVSTMILNHIIPNPDHVLNRLMFTESGLSLVEKYFEQSLGAFSSSHKGSFLFWGLDAHGHRLHLGREQLTWEPHRIRQLLLKKQLYPTTLICSLVLLYYGVTSLGGFNQVNWLTNIKQKFSDILGQMDLLELAEKIVKVPTNNFAEANLAFLPRNGRLLKATGMDLYLSGKDYFNNYQALAKQLTMAESLESLLPEIYRVITPSDERREDLMAITDVKLAKENGMEQKIKSVFE